MKSLWYLLALLTACGVLTPLAQAQEQAMAWPEPIQIVLDETKPLEHDRGGRLPLYLWPAILSADLNEERAEELVKLLDERGVGLVASWNHNDMEKSLARALPVAKAQKKLGLRVNINANSPMYSFFDGSEGTAHLDAEGKPFFDDTFGKKDMGCPFRLEHRIAPMKKRITDFVDAYAAAGLPLDFVFADWEIDGPLEWNHAQDASKRCTVCNANVNVDDFLSYQRVLREERSRLQRLVYANPIREKNPEVLVGNYAIYPHDGFRYWFDYFEKCVPTQPAVRDQKAYYRHWANDFEATNYSYAMPVYYNWSWSWNWYDFESSDYRWFYNTLKVASNAGRHTPKETPIIAFVHWHTVELGTTCLEGEDPESLPKEKQMSETAYQEFLWHALLRGTDTFFLWCMQKENTKEVQLLHPVWAAAQEYGNYLENGTPITFDVPKEEGPVVSGLRLGNNVLVRRTDFTDSAEPVEISVAGQRISVPRVEGECQVIALK